MVIKMKIYLDLVMILNFCFDFLLLLSVSILLKRNIKIERIIFGSFIGGLSILTLFININSLELFIIKIIISIIMILISFGYKDIKYFLKNILFLYMASIILGGFLYFLNINFSYKNNGLIFYYKGISINFIFLIITSPIILYIYIKQGIWLKQNYNNYYKIDIYYNNKIIKCNGFLDTGNKLIDPYFGKPIILVSKKIEIDNYFLVPYQGIKKGMIKCIKVDKIYIENIGYRKKVIVGFIDKIKIDGIDCLLNINILEGK